METHSVPATARALVPYFILGVASATIGLLPWILTGMRLPLQNLWASATPPDDMPLVLLPFSQYLLTLIVGLLVTGSAIAGIISRLSKPRHPRFALTAVAMGTVGVQLTATLQTFNTVGDGLLRNPAAELYLTALLYGSIASILIGLLVLVLIAKAPAPGAVAASSIAAVCCGLWLEGLLFPIDSLATLSAAALALVRWSPAVILGVAVGIAGLKSVGRVLAAVFGVLMLWVAPALFTAISVGGGTRVLAYQPAAMAQLGAEVFLNTLHPTPSTLVPLAIAVAVAVLVLAVSRTVRRGKLSRVAVR